MEKRWALDVYKRQDLYTREYQFLLEKAKKRLEIVEGLMKATDVIDLIIEILRGSSSVKQMCIRDRWRSNYFGKRYLL